MGRRPGSRANRLGRRQPVDGFRLDGECPCIGAAIPGDNFAKPLRVNHGLVAQQGQADPRRVLRYSSARCTPKSKRSRMVGTRPLTPRTSTSTLRRPAPPHGRPVPTRRASCAGTSRARELDVPRVDPYRDADPEQRADQAGSPGPAERPAGSRSGARRGAHEFFDELGVSQSFMLCGRSPSGGAGCSPRCHRGAMWMIELAMNTSTAETRSAARARKCRS